MTKEELLKMIDDGAYGADLPMDDETNGLLAECMDEGLIKGESARMDDFFWLTPKGWKQIAA